MASISRDPNGRRRILFFGADGKRKTVRLGKINQRQAESIRVHIERLLSAAKSGQSIPDDTAVWLANLPETLSAKLASAGVFQRPEKRDCPTLGEFLERYRTKRVDVKETTQTVWRHTRRNLLEFFGDEKSIDEITKGDAEEWRLYLVGQGLAESTIRKRCGFAKQFFTFAVKHEMIVSNPFAELKSSARANPKRFYFVGREDAENVLEACPNAEWRLLFALSRYGGLRCPSEHLALRWGDVDWDRGRILVRSRKTEHHEGRESRLMPLFPELRPYLDDCWQLAEPGAEFVITRYRNASQNLRTQLLRIIERAGLQPWPKLFQNLRSTRQTELQEQFPTHVVCAWLGNSEQIAREHYLQVTDDHFARALDGDDPQAAQKAAQYGAELSRKASQRRKAAHEKTPVLQGFAADCDSVQNRGMEDRGLEPLTS